MYRTVFKGMSWTILSSQGLEDTNLLGLYYNPPCYTDEIECRIACKILNGEY